MKFLGPAPPIRNECDFTEACALERLNYQHLHYFWTVAKAGSIKSACEILGLAQPTISGQIALFEKAIGVTLFKREGRKLVLTDSGALVFGYADEIFSIGDNLKRWLKGESAERRKKLRIGACRNVDTLILLQLLAPALKDVETPQISCSRGDVERLLVDVEMRTIDLAIMSTPPTNSENKAFFSRLIATMEISVFRSVAQAKEYTENFPWSLDRAPVALPTGGDPLRKSLDVWFQSEAIEPEIQAEIGDGELLKGIAAKSGALFFAPTIAAEVIRSRYGFRNLGIVAGVKEKLYVVSNQRKRRNPLAAMIIGSI